MSELSVLYDACVLYPAPLRDTLMSLAVTRLFQAHWTEVIHDEWIRNLLADRADISPDQLNRTRLVMNRAIPDSLVTGYEKLIKTLILPDPGDRHVLAAAIHSKSGLIITFNLKDFPSDILSRYGIEARHPDDFITQLLVEHTDQILVALKKQRVRLVSPSYSTEEFLAILERQGLNQSVSLLRPLSDSL